MVYITTKCDNCGEANAKFSQRIKDLIKACKIKDAEITLLNNKKKRLFQQRYELRTFIEDTGQSQKYKEWITKKRNG